MLGPRGAQALIVRGEGQVDPGVFPPPVSHPLPELLAPLGGTPGFFTGEHVDKSLVRFGSHTFKSLL